MAPNNRFFLNLLQYYSRNQAKQGFVLPTLIGLGLIMTVVGLTMIVAPAMSNKLLSHKNRALKL